MTRRFALPFCFALCGEQKHKAAQDESDALKLEVEKVAKLEATSTELQSKAGAVAAAIPSISTTVTNSSRATPGAVAVAA